MSWLDPPRALALVGANRLVDQCEVLIDSMASTYWFGVV